MDKILWCHTAVKKYECDFGQPLWGGIIPLMSGSRSPFWCALIQTLLKAVCSALHISLPGDPGSWREFSQRNLTVKKKKKVS